MNAPFKPPSQDFRISLTRSGKLHLPVELRRKLDMEGGGPLIATYEDGEIKLTTIRARMEAACAMIAPFVKDDSVDKFLADRREEAKREWDEGL
jgi:bifunctional DNA-binding transcriptional regulator/antitoxin component of YhaV-PrlF toxin-antitoxin module